MKVVETIYLIAPLLVAGVVHGPVIKRNLLAPLARPLDFGSTFRGAPVFGANKTWRGVLVMSTVSVFVVLVQSELYAFGSFRSISTPALYPSRGPGASSAIAAAASSRSSKWILVLPRIW